MVLQQQINTCTGCVEFVINLNFQQVLLCLKISQIFKLRWSDVITMKKNNKKQLHQELNKLIPSQSAVQTAK